MAHAAWGEEGLDWDPSGFPAPRWKHLIPALPIPARPVTLALPCVGLDGACNGLRAIGIPFVARYVVDVAGYLRRPLAAVHGADEAERFDLGPLDGDLLQHDIEDWDRVDGIISGPPCPPWSRIGRRLRKDDARAKVFDRVTDLIIDQARKGCFFFIVEMVPGMNDRSATGHGASETPYQSWLAQLRDAAPTWTVRTWEQNTAEYMPQHRKRLYTADH